MEDSTFWNDLLQNVLMQLLPLLAVAVVGYVGSVATKAWGTFKNNQPDKAWLIERAASLAIKAAEQAGAAGYIEDKKEFALDVAEKWLHANGVKIDLGLIDAAIEAAVFEELNKEKPKEFTPSVGFAGMAGPVTLSEIDDDRG